MTIYVKLSVYIVLVRQVRSLQVSVPLRSLLALGFLINWAASICVLLVCVRKPVYFSVKVLSVSVGSCGVISHCSVSQHD